MNALPSVAPFAGLIADLARDLARGTCCLVVCDKGWTLAVFRAVWERLKAKNVRCEYLDGRPPRDDASPTEVGIMLTAIAQIRRAVRVEPEGDDVRAVYALPHLDVMTAQEGEWTNISREMVPLLYENAATVWLGFRDPSLALFPVVEKLFSRRYEITAPFRDQETAAPTPPEPEPTVAEQPPEEPATEQPLGQPPEAPRDGPDEPPPDAVTSASTGPG